MCGAVHGETATAALRRTPAAGVAALDRTPAAPWLRRPLTLPGRRAFGRTTASVSAKKVRPASMWHASTIDSHPPPGLPRCAPTLPTTGSAVRAGRRRRVGGRDRGRASSRRPWPAKKARRRQFAPPHLAIPPAPPRGAPRIAVARLGRRRPPSAGRDAHLGRRSGRGARELRLDEAEGVRSWRRREDPRDADRRGDRIPRENIESVLPPGAGRDRGLTGALAGPHRPATNRGPARAG